jgi:SAM-dependent methyltransferase
MSEEKKIPKNEAVARKELREWLLTTPGKLILALEKRYFDQVLSNLFGYNIVQLGCVDEVGVLENSRIAHKVITQLEHDGEPVNGVSCLHASDALSLASDSIDVLVLPHVLEYTSNPHQLLREIDRVLIGEGHVVISGFNPFSFMGLWRLFLAWRGTPPWHGHFYRLFRIKDWITLLDFDVVSCHYFFYRPPLKSDTIMAKIEFLENLGKYCWPILSGVFILVAKKRVIPLTPVKHQWLNRRKSITSGIAEPTTRSFKHKA